uniref:PPM-type phosphatase domain-containing protein n=1 Tax=Lactuca sativa TaxID=4236 RepID=A0A9R1VZE4_LACSA|nr:hypothetical protein LSAT_V11C400173220 [Lactuca sativa]
MSFLMLVWLFQLHTYHLVYLTRLPFFFYAIFDGHYSSITTSYLKNHAMKLFFQEYELPQSSYKRLSFLMDVKHSHYKAFLLADQTLTN